MKRKRTEITIETERVLVVSVGRRARAWCAPCGRQVEMLSVDEAAALARVTSVTIFSWAADDRLHFTQAHEGTLLICANSLLK